MKEIIWTSNKITLVWTLIIVGELLGLYCVYLGLKKNKEKDVRFKITDLFQNRSVKESSGTQLIIEGLFVMAAGLFFYCVLFY